jgi:hypothetical protein
MTDRGFSTLDVAGSIPVELRASIRKITWGPALATLSGNIRLISAAGMGANTHG